MEIGKPEFEIEVSPQVEPIPAREPSEAPEKVETTTPEKEPVGV